MGVKMAKSLLDFRYPVDVGYPPRTVPRTYPVDALVRRVLCRKRTEHHLCWIDTVIQAALDVVWPVVIDPFTRCPCCFRRGCRKHQD